MVARLTPVPDQIKSALLPARRHGNSFCGACGRDGADLNSVWWRKCPRVFAKSEPRHSALRRFEDDAVSYCPPDERSPPRAVWGAAQAQSTSKPLLTLQMPALPDPVRLPLTPRPPPCWYSTTLSPSATPSR